MEAEDALSQNIEYVDDLCSMAKSYTIIPEGCTTANLITENGEAVTLILSQHIADGVDGAQPIEEIMEAHGCDIIPEAPPESLEEVPHEELDAQNTDGDLVVEEPKDVTAMHFPSSSKSGNSNVLQIAENQTKVSHGRKNFVSEISSENNLGPSDVDEEYQSATNLEDFMDVVTTYKCKFCRFSCPWKSGLVSHIRCCHIQEDKKSPLKNDHKEPNIVTARKSIDQPSVSLQNEESFSQEVDDSSNPNSQDVPTDHNPESSSKFMKITETESDSEQSSKDSPLQERHVFLCGQCSEGFMSLDACKQHMINDHDIKLEQKTLKTLGKRRKMPKTRTTWSKPEGKAKRLSRYLKTPEIEDINANIKKQKKASVYLKHLRCHFQGCGQRFSSNEFLQYHFTCHAPGGGKSFFCPDCPDRHDNWRTLVMHLWKEHSVDIDMLACTECNYKTYSHFKLDNHKRIHSDERLFMCKLCGKSFKQTSQLRNHLVIHMDRKNLTEKRWYSVQECDICGRKFSDSKCLRKHIQAVHSKIKPYVCTFCGHRSARKAMLNLHIRQHTGEKPFQCEHCEYRTADHNSLRRHRMRHSGKKPYKCPHCSYACIQAISYKTHFRNKHPGMEGLFTCSVCPFKSVSKENYVNHMNDHKREGVSVNEDSNNDSQSSSMNFEIVSPENPSVQMQLNDNALQQLEGILPGNITAAQLIYSCLNALSQENGTINLPPGVTVNLPPTTTSTVDGTQTITIQLPTSQDSENEPYYFTIQPDENETTLVIPDEEDADDEGANAEESGDLDNVGFSGQDVSGTSLQLVLKEEEDDDEEAVDGNIIEVSNVDSLVMNHMEGYDSEGFIAVVDSKD